MYLHIGNDTVIKTSEIITILDAKTISGSATMQKFLSENKVINLTEGTGKSIVVTCDDIYISPLGSVALKRKSLKMATY